MGHLSGKDIYQELANKFSKMGVGLKAVKNEKLYKILRELYSEEEADFISKMPYGLSSLKKIVKTTGYSKEKVEELLSILCPKGLVMDLDSKDGFNYAPSPYVIGFFEFTMMRVGEDLPYKKWAELFNDYMGNDPSLYSSNFSNGELIGVGRALVHEESVKNVTDENYTEVLDYESALSIIDKAEVCAVGICSCGHEKYHLDEKKCDHPLERCLNFGDAAKYLIRNKLAKKISNDEAKKMVMESKKNGLVFIADTYKRDVSFICQCCSCCCNILSGISKYGFLNAVTSSSYILNIDDANCTGCNRCVKACPINAIELKDRVARLNSEVCIGCGVCVPTCKTKLLSMTKRKKRVYLPETFMQKALLSNLERGTLQNFVFDNPNSKSQEFLRVILGAFLSLPPVKKGLMSAIFKSSFLGSKLNK